VKEKWIAAQTKLKNGRKRKDRVDYDLGKKSTLGKRQMHQTGGSFGEPQKKKKRIAQKHSRAIQTRGTQGVLDHVISRMQRGGNLCKKEEVGGRGQ